MLLIPVTGSYSHRCLTISHGWTFLSLLCYGGHCCVSCVLLVAKTSQEETAQSVHATEVREIESSLFGRSDSALQEHFFFSFSAEMLLCSWKWPTFRNRKNKARIKCRSLYILIELHILGSLKIEWIWGGKELRTNKLLETLHLHFSKIDCSGASEDSKINILKYVPTSYCVWVLFVQTNQKMPPIHRAIWFMLSPYNMFPNWYQKTS